MSSRKILALGIGTAFLVLTAAFVVADDIKDVIKIQSSLWPNPTKGPVEFTHKKHAETYKVACDKCHHVYKDGKNVWKQGDDVKRCQACHNEPTIEGEKRLSPDLQKLNLKLAFHTNCQECHKELKKSDKAGKAPVTCTGCHPKQGR